MAEAYGWPADLADEEILARLVALNHQRAEEERRGLVRWLRPEFQHREGATQKTIAAETDEAPAAKPAKVEKLAWPKTLSEQAAAVQTALAALAAPADEDALAKRFHRANKDRIAELLETLASLGKARAWTTAVMWRYEAAAGNPQRKRGSPTETRSVSEGMRCPVASWLRSLAYASDRGLSPRGTQP